MRRWFGGREVGEGVGRVASVEVSGELGWTVAERNVGGRVAGVRDVAGIVSERGNPAAGDESERMQREETNLELNVLRCLLLLYVAHRSLLILFASLL